MPEPDLVTLGDRTVVDCASIVAHLNTRGNFELAPITVSEECTLRTRSRIQQGVQMETGSMLLEKVRCLPFMHHGRGTRPLKSSRLTLWLLVCVALALPLAVAGHDW